MANVYVYSGAAGTGTGASWVNAYTTLAAAFTGGTNGDSFWVAHDHAETQASLMSLTHGSFSAPSKIICVNRAGSVPPVSADLRTTATISTTGNNGMLINGVFYVRGVIFNCGSGAVNAQINFANSVSSRITLEYCAVNKVGTISASSDSLVFGNGNYGVIRFLNTTVSLGSINDIVNIYQRARFTWINDPSLPPFTGTVPSTLFATEGPGTTNLEGLDMSAAGYASSTFAIYFANGHFYIKNCKLNAGMTISTPGSAAVVHKINSDSAATNYRNERIAYEGSQVHETTIVRTGGATDGTTPVSTKIVTTANVSLPFPYESMPFVIWNDTTAANVTVTVYGIWGGGAVPNNDDIWIEVSYMGSAGSPIATIDTSNGKADFLATNAAQGTDAVSTWGGSTTKFKMSVTITPAMKGLIYVYTKAAASSATFYIDPDPVLS